MSSPSITSVLWYAGYGSNLDRGRFLHYLDGGAPPGAARAVHGARDPRPPREERAVVLPGTMFFGWSSPTWGGGISFLDVDAESDGSYARAYLLTEQQFADVVAQEMHRSPVQDLDLTVVLQRGRDVLGPGRYETLHHVGSIAGVPMLTFSAGTVAEIEHNPPTVKYLRVVARGLRATHALDTDAIVDYLLARPGIGDWSREGLAAVL